MENATLAEITDQMKFLEHSFKIFEIIGNRLSSSAIPALAAGVGM